MIVRRPTVNQIDVTSPASLQRSPCVPCLSIRLSQSLFRQCLASISPKDCNPCRGCPAGMRILDGHAYGKRRGSPTNANPVFPSGINSAPIPMSMPPAK
jgi:hypothetical protein